MKYTSIATAAAAIMLLASCSLFQRNATGTGKDSYTTQGVKAPKKDKNGNVVVETPAAKTPAQISATDLGGSQWQVAMVGKEAVTAEEDVPYVVFDTATGRFYASDGCNIINGDFALRTNGQLAFSGVLSTMKYCPDVEYSAAIAAAINDDSRLTASTKRIGQETYLYLANPQGDTVLTLRRHNMEFLNGNWLVTAIDGKAINDEECNLFIDIPELKVHGNTGCNYFNGTVFIDPQRANAIEFGNMGVTRMACPKTAQETAMLVALEEARTAIAGKNENTVLVLDAKGKQVLTLKRIPLPEN